MKKVLALLTVSILCVSMLAACGGGTVPESSTAPSESSSAPSTPEVIDDSSGADYYDQDLDITNSTGVDILEMYISPSDDNMWGPDLLAGSIFAAGETMHFTTELVGTADATWDIRIIDEDYDEVVFEDISFSSSVALNLHWGPDGQTPTVDMIGSDDNQYYSQDLDITNSTGVDILEMYISPSDDAYWGEDLLADSIFEAGETVRFTTATVGTADATWDIRIIDEDGDEVVFEDISFSSSTALNLHWGPDGLTPTVDFY